MARPSPFVAARGLPARKTALPAARAARGYGIGTRPHVELRGPRTRAPAQCETILRSLPGWFEVEEAVRQYATDSARYPTFAVWHRRRLLGFATVRRHYGVTWELHCLAVHAEWLGRGFGSRLLRQAEGWVREQGGRFLQVKTVGPSHPSREYRGTRAFYARLGYVPLEEFHGLWGPRCPCLQLIKYLGR